MTKQKYYEHEALDRTYILIEMVSNLLENHPALLEKERVKIEKVSTMLNQVYQSIGARK